MNHSSPRQRALIPLVFVAILSAYVLGRIWIDRPRDEARATEAGLVPSPREAPASATGRGGR